MADNYSHFIPRNDAEKAVWMGNFKEKSNTHSANLGITAVEQTRIDTCTDTCISVLNAVNTKKKEQNEAVERKNLLAKNEIKELIDFSIRMKRHPNYTENIGKELGIIGTASAIQEREVLKPVIKLVISPDYVSIKFTKKGQKGVTIFTRIKGNMGWDALIHGATQSPFLDNRSLAQAGIPENREYMARFWANGTEIGQESDIISATFKGK